MRTFVSAAPHGRSEVLVVTMLDGELNNVLLRDAAELNAEMAAQQQARSDASSAHAARVLQADAALDAAIVSADEARVVALGGVAPDDQDRDAKVAAANAARDEAVAAARESHALSVEQSRATLDAALAPIAEQVKLSESKAWAAAKEQVKPVEPTEPTEQ